MGETRNCFNFITILTKLLGSFPVSENGNKIVFLWCSFRTFCFLTTFLFSLIHFLFNIYENVLGYVLIVLDINGMTIQISFLIMAMNWSELGKECDRIDCYMKDYRFPKYLKLKLHAACVILMVLCLVVYTLYNVSMSRIPAIELHTFISIWRAVAKTVKQDTSFAEGCKLLLVIVQQLSHWQVAMLRCCADIFIVTVSVILAMRFRQIAERIDLLVQGVVRDKNVWMRIREDYQRICIFCEKWDNVLGYLVLSSFISNIYSLLLHLQMALKASEQKIDALYATSACIESLFRCIMVCYAAGNVYAEGRRFIQLLCLVPSDVFNDEIERMLLQIRQGQPALTGKHLFTVKHSLILQIIGGIATHEIILLQYYYAPYLK